MKSHRFILLIFALVLFCGGSCKRKEGQRLVIQNNSDEAIVIAFSIHTPISQMPRCIKPPTSFEYADVVTRRTIYTNSEKNFERLSWGNCLLEQPDKIFYFGVFYRIDIDQMSCDEFEQVFPLKKEWAVTAADMEACDWTLVYDPEEE